MIQDESRLPELRQRLGDSGIAAAAGAGAIAEAAGQGADWVMSAIVGSAGLAPTLAAARAGSVIGLANKESLVCAGPALLAIATAAGGRVIPVDSEHSAIFQVYERVNIERIRRLILTASGGPFRGWSLEAMKGATREQAVARERALIDRVNADRRRLQDKNRIIQEAGQVALGQIERTLIGIIRQVAESRGMNLVLHRSQVALNVQEFDITEAVALQLNKALPTVQIPPDGVDPATLPKDWGSPAPTPVAAH